MSIHGELADVKVFKFDPTADKQSSWKTYHVPFKGMSVLRILKAIYKDLHGDLAFRWGCEGAGDCRCGACVVMVNDRPALACRRTAEAKMVIEPHPKFEIIKDLVVNFNKVREGGRKRIPSVRITIDTDKCTKCADCLSICPVGVYKAEKGAIILADIESCCGDSCFQCVTFCQEGAICVEPL